MFDNAQLCSECGGQCCQESAGAAFPEDFGLKEPALDDFSQLRSALISGKWKIDCWDGEPRVLRNIPKGEQELTTAYYIRPAHVDESADNVFCRGWGGTCVFFTRGVGCQLSSDNRPRNCRMLEPRKDRAASPAGVDCVMHNGADKHASAIAWIPYIPWLTDFRNTQYSAVQAVRSTV